MRRDEFLLLFDYETWATQRVLSAAAALAPGEFAKAGPGGTSLGDAFAHFFLARQGFRQVIQRTPRRFADLRAEFDAMDFSTSARCLEWLEAEHAATHAALESVSDAELEELVAVGGGPNKRMLPPWQVMTHVVTHGTQHRAELAALLTGLGHSPGDLDFIQYGRGLADPPVGRPACPPETLW